MSAGHGQVAHPGERFARTYAHAGMVAYDGEKMSKSKGNLVFVSALRMSEVDPMAIRLVLLRHHYRSDWEWTDDQLWDAVDTLATWRKALTLGAGAPAAPVVETVLGALSSDLDAPAAVAAIQAWVDATLGVDGLAETSDNDAATIIRAVADAALGLSL
jgi:L-cysteine:1D-myo-inositol 2-amino-2-deoxy-alpha-D-glucopyranoside ligase